MRIVREALSIILIIGLILTGLSGCVENNVESDVDSEALELPPQSSMSMDFSDFGGGKMAPGMVPAGKNFKAAAGRVILLDIIVIAVLAAPVGLFKSATTTVPMRQPGGSWLWDYDVDFLGQTYEANLTGSLEGFKTVWSMSVTNPSRRIPLDDFEWYYGEAALNNKSGSWHFFDPATPDDGNEVATIEWSVKGINKGTIVYTNTNERGPNFGDTLSYTVDGTTATILFYDASKNLEADIDWDLFTVEGSIKVPDYNGGERAYWDADQQDIWP